MFKEKNGVIKVRNSRKAYLGIYFLIIVLVITVFVIKSYGLELNTLAVLGVILFIILSIKYTELHRLNNSWEVNPSSVVHNKGLINRKTKKADFFAVSDIDFNQNFWQRMLNYGNVNVHLFSKDYTIVVRKINHPGNFVDYLERKIREKRGVSESGGGLGG